MKLVVALGLFKVVNNTASSLSVIVILTVVGDPNPIPLVGFDIVRVAVSEASRRLSSNIVNVDVPVVLPARILICIPTAASPSVIE